MKKQKKNIIIVCIVVIILFILGYFGIKYYKAKELERKKQELQEFVEKYGTLEKETVETTIAKFNSQIKDNSNLNLAMDNYLTVDNEQYWYGLIEGIYCFVIPEKFSGDYKKDITKEINIYYDKENNYKEDVIKYVKFLIKANNNEITDNEVGELITNAQELIKKNKAAINGKGISLGIFESEEHIEYQITRFYQ